MEYTAIISLLSLLAVSAVLTAMSRDLFAAVLLLGIYSLLSAGLFVTLDAPDVAFTEAAVGAGFSTVLFLAAIAATAHLRAYAPKHSMPAVILVVMTGCMLLYALPDMPQFATPDAPAHQHVARYYLEHTQAQVGIPNVVTAVLASYRGFDTFGELIVIFTAGIGVIGVLTAGRRRRTRLSEQTSD